MQIATFLVGTFIGLLFKAAVMLGVIDGLNKSHARQEQRQRKAANGESPDAESKPKQKGKRPAAVPTPAVWIPKADLGKALSISLQRILLLNTVGVILGWAFFGLDFSKPPGATDNGIGSGLLPLVLMAYALCFLPCVWLIKFNLETSFNKACLVQVLEYGVYALVWGMVFLIYAAFASQPGSFL